MKELWQKVYHTFHLNLDKLIRVLAKIHPKLPTISYAAVLVSILGVGTVMVAADDEIEIDLSNSKPVKEVDLSKFSVVHAGPKGKIHAGDYRKEIVVVFSQPVVPLSILDEIIDNKPFTIDPPLKGKHRWYGSRAVGFEPAEAYAPASKYRITVPANLKNLKGKALGKKFTFTFETDDFVVNYIYPRGGSKVWPKQRFTVEFNHEVNINSAQNKIRLIVNGNTVGSKVFYAGSKEKPNKKSLRVEPTGKYKNNSKVEIRIAKGIRPLRGQGSLKRGYSESVKTYGPMDADFETDNSFFQNFSPRLYFSNPINRDTIKNFISIDGLKTPKRLYGYGQNVYLNAWPIKPGKNYTVRIKGGLTDRFGNKYIGDKKFTFKTPLYRPNFSTIDSGVRYIEAKQAKKIPLYLTAMDNIEVEYGSFDHGDLLSYERKRSDFPSGDHDDILKFGLTGTQRKTVAFDLAKYFEKSNWLSLDIYGEVTDYYGKPADRSVKILVVNSDLGVSVKEDYRSSFIWVHSLSSGAAVSGASVSAFLDNDGFGSCTTGDDGFCKIDNDTGRLEDYTSYIVQKDDDKTIVTERTNRKGIWGISPNFSERAALPELVGQVVFDRRLYRPGDKMMFKAFLAVREKGKVLTDEDAMGDLRVTIRNAQGDEVFNNKYEPSDNGGIHGEYSIPGDAPLGHYSIRVATDEFPKYNRGATVAETFQVEEFRPVSFYVETKGLKPGYATETKNVTISGQYLYGAPMSNARMRYKVNRRPYNPYIDGYDGYSFGDWDYGDYWEPSGWNEINSGSGKLDGAGNKKLKVYYPKLKVHGSTDTELSRHYKLEVSSTVFDIDDRSVANTKKVTVYADKDLVGIEAKDSYHKYTKPFEFNLLTIDAKSKLRTAGTVTAVVHRKEWKSIKTKGAGGSVQTKNTLVRTEVFRKQVNLTKDGGLFSYTVKKSGNYTLTVSKGRSYSRQNFYAYGGDFIGWDYENDDKVKMLSDKREYKVGDTAKILLKSPFKKATAVVSVERESLVWQKTFKIDGNSSPIKVPIKKSFAPNVYVSVMLIRPRIKNFKKSTPAKPNEDLGRPVIKLGTIQLNVDTKNKRLPLTVKTNKKSYKPGSDFRLTINTLPGAEVALSIADRAVLDLINYRFSDPLPVFYAELPHGVRVLENREALIKQLAFANKGNDPGGKGEQAALKGKGGFDDDSEDGRRRNFKHTAYWGPKLIADSDGKIVIKGKLPDNLTTFRVQALAAKAGKYNKTISEIKVKKPVLIQVNAPRLIRPDDQISMSTLIHNRTKKAVTFDIQVKSKNDFLKWKGSGKTYGTLTLAPDQAKEFNTALSLDYTAFYKAKHEMIYKPDFDPKKDFLEISGEVRVRPQNKKELYALGLEDSDINDIVGFKIPIREHPPGEAFTVAGFVPKKSSATADEVFRVPKENQVWPEIGGLQIQLATTALTGIDKGFGFFHAKPYFCMEQRTSAFALSMAAGKLLKKFNVRSNDPLGYDFTQTNRLFLEEMVQFQRSDGGFGAWKNSRYSSPYLTAYVVHVMLNALEQNKISGAGYEVNKSALDDAVDYLRDYMQKSDKRRLEYALETLAFINYIGARSGSLPGLRSFLFKKYKHLSLRAKGYLLLAMLARDGTSETAQDEGAQKILLEIKNSIEITTRRIRFRDVSSSSLASAYYGEGSLMAVMLQVFMQLEPQNQLTDKMVKHAVKTKEYWWDSHSVGNLAYALWKYNHLFEGEADYDGKFKLGSINKSFAMATTDINKTMRSYFMPMQKVLSLGDVAANKNDLPLIFSKSDKGRLYYTATLDYAPKFRSAQSFDSGIEIRRETIDLAAGGKKIKPQAGKLILQRGKVYLQRIVVINPKPIYDFLLEDPVPATSEIVNAQFATEGTEYARFLAKKRSKDTDWWWWEDETPNYEHRDDRFIATQPYLSAGIHEFFYLSRTTSRGTATSPNVRAEAMYEPETFGRGRRLFQVVE